MKSVLILLKVLHEGVGELVCCGQPMKLFYESTLDTSFEKTCDRDPKS